MHRVFANSAEKENNGEVFTGKKSHCSCPRHDKKDIVDETEPAAFSLSRSKDRTIISKSVDEMALLCSIYNDEFRNFGGGGRT